jgi:hypothetical protein
VPGRPNEREQAWAERFAPPRPTGDIAAYLRTHSARYTREALDRRLLAAGHTPEAISAAWATVQAEDAAAGRRDRRSQTARIIGGAYVLTWLLVVLLAIVPKPDTTYASTPLLAAILAVSLFIPGSIAVIIARGWGGLRRAGAGRVAAFAVLPMIVLFAIAGTCISFMQGY